MRGPTVGAELHERLHGTRAIRMADRLELGHGQDPFVAQLFEQCRRRGVVLDVPAQGGARDLDIDIARVEQRGRPLIDRVVCGREL